MRQLQSKILFGLLVSILSIRPADGQFGAGLPGAGGGSGAAPGMSAELGVVGMDGGSSGMGMGAGPMGGGMDGMPGGMMGSYGGGSGMMVSPTFQVTSPVLVHRANQQQDEVAFTHAYSYLIAPGMAKPKRVVFQPATGSYGVVHSRGPFGIKNNVIVPEGPSKQLVIVRPEYNLPNPNSPSAALNQIIHVLVRDSDAVDQNPILLVAQKRQTSVQNEGSLAPMAEMGGEGGMGSAVPADNQLFAQSMELVPLEEAKSIVIGMNQSPQTPDELKRLSDLIRLDIQIEDRASKLATYRGDAEKFRAAETELRTLLAREYEAQIARQRSEIGRLIAKVKQLQEELERRQGAAERVVDVQLGKLVLEAQGLIGEGNAQ